MSFPNYYPDIPQENDDPTDSQPLILSNFRTINQQFAVNHIPLTDSDLNGFHTHVNLVEQTADPAADPSGPQIYSKKVTYPGAVDRIEEFFRSSLGTITQMSNTFNNPIIAASGSTFLPGGLMIKWGKVNVPGNAGTLVAFASAFPNALFSSVVTPTNQLSTFGSVPAVTAAGLTSITIYNGNPGAQDIYYIAIGN